MPNTAIGVEDGLACYDYVCEACGAEGDLRVPEGLHRFRCPDECGAVYVQWKDRGRWRLHCVVRPVFEDDVYGCEYEDEEERP